MELIQCLSPKSELPSLGTDSTISLFQVIISNPDSDMHQVKKKTILNKKKNIHINLFTTLLVVSIFTHVSKTSMLLHTLCIWAGDPGLIPGLGRSPGEGNGNPLQYACLENPMEPGRLQSMGSQELDTTEQLSTHSSVSFNPEAQWNK